ncbi:MAG: hypothetical protein KJZ77_13840 [Anaerolineales bacterium]|nr:hypothetical protein [Anaerolineales bacterium]
MDILRDSVWQFWGVVVAIIGVVLSAIFFLAQKNKKRLAYQVLTDTPLLSVSDEIKGKIKIEYEERSIQNIHLVILKVENIGNIDIPASDYEKGIVFNFPNSEILSAEVSETSPKNLKPALKIEPFSLIIDPIMLNKKDHIVCKIIFANFGDVIEADVRILGVKDIERASSSDGTPPAWYGYFLIVVAALATYASGVFSLAYWGISAQESGDPKILWSAIISGFLALIYYITIAFDLIISKTKT